MFRICLNFNMYSSNYYLRIINQKLNEKSCTVFGNVTDHFCPIADRVQEQFKNSNT